MNPSPATSRRALVARCVPVDSLTDDLVRDAFALFEDAYAGADRARFERDLREKQRIILLHDAEHGGLRGFSTVRIEQRRAPRPCTVIFSGDTVIHRDYWGQKQLQAAFARILLAEKLRAPHRPLYWLLLSKGYRTYMLLANAFPRAVPRYDRPLDDDLTPVLHQLAGERFGEQYDATSGLVRFVAGERVREGLAPITRHHLANPHVCYFVARNPRHADGEELACLADVRLVDLARIAARLVAARVRRWGSRDARRARPARPVPAGGRRVDVPQAEGV